jgi:hypothetical protein
LAAFALLACMACRAQGRGRRRAREHGNHYIEDGPVTIKQPDTDAKPTKVVANDPADRKGALKSIGGSQSDNWNNLLSNQAMNALWLKNSDAETRDQKFSATVAALMGIAPNDERPASPRRGIECLAIGAPEPHDVSSAEFFCAEFCRQDFSCL